MTTEELRDLIKSSKSIEFFNDIEVTIPFKYGQEHIVLKGVTSIYNFLIKQVEGWKNYDTSITKEFKQSINYYNNLMGRILTFVQNNLNSDLITLKNKWRNEANYFTDTSEIFLYDTPITDFLIGVLRNYPQSFSGSKRFFTGTPVLNNQNDLLGTIMSYEYLMKDNSDIVARRENEKKSLSQLRTEYQKKLAEADTQLTVYFSKSDNKYEEYAKEIDDLKNSKEESISSWFDRRKKDVAEFEEDSKRKIIDLQKAYNELLSLETPATYWRERATKLKKEGWRSLYWMIGLVFGGAISLFLLLWLTPKGVLLNFIDDPASSVKWSIIYITFITLLAYGIRILHKVSFSSFHLARDAEEREHLTFVYLAMIKVSSIEAEDRSLVMQALFSRADTGLLKNDTGPTMPNDLTGKIFASNQ